MKNQFTFLLLFSLFLSACSPAEEPEPRELTAAEKDVIAYFGEVALGYEFGSASEITRKWTSDMRVFVGGKPTAENRNELKKISDEINSLATDGFSVEMVNDSLQSNFYIFLGSGSEYAKKYPSQTNFIASPYLFSVFWDANNQINRGHMYVDIIRANANDQKYLLRKGLTRALGIGQVSALYPESIFYNKYSFLTAYVPIDREVIRLLYHPRVPIGLGESEVKELLEDILLEE